MKKVCIIDGSRIPFVRSGTKYMGLSNKDLMSAALKGLVEKLGLQGKEIGEVVLGSVVKHAADFNLARECTIEAGLSMRTPATDLQKACGTSLEAVVSLANKIALGQIDSGIAGGTDTNSEIPIEFKKEFSDRMLKLNYARSTADKLKALVGFNPKDLMPNLPGITEPRTGKSMGEGCEQMAKQWGISREEQDQLALESHHKAAAAYETGFYNDLVVPFKGAEKDSIIRPDTSMDKMRKLRPVFDRTETGTLTAANSSSLTDGAACVFVCSEEYAKENKLEVMAYFSTAQSAACDFVGDEGLLLAPAFAVPKLLKRAQLTLQDFDFYEIHEAFAAQVLCTLKAWEDENWSREKTGLPALGSIDRSKMNVMGGSVAMGHPFAATGARIVTGLAKLLQQKGSGRGLISICTAGGMGVTAIIER
ncbi:MAG: acetyl-CoA C-acetyltransferase [Halobacteriovoraceae bacterium]|jgi:acetyl-CoA C-acetyltransferase|nr:acetyl-CoA C-acetyltransferase [Halobacteriovoraceae bacterium]MBT5093355.1 acetyl-CoA C-acetyltransferase [Halobacteriovoraceae bacterium]